MEQKMQNDLCCITYILGTPLGDNNHSLLMTQQSIYPSYRKGDTIFLKHETHGDVDKSYSDEELLTI